jgi:hypothetical protein
MLMAPSNVWLTKFVSSVSVETKALRHQGPASPREANRFSEHQHANDGSYRLRVFDAVFFIKQFRSSLRGLRKKL